MKKYEQFGIYDFSDFAEELETSELILINGGSCGGGCGGGSSGGGGSSPKGPSGPTGPTSSPSSSTPSIYGQCGGFVPTSPNERSGDGYPKNYEQNSKLEREMYSTGTQETGKVNGKSFTALIDFKKGLNKFDVGFQSDSNLKLDGKVYIIEKKNGISSYFDTSISTNDYISGMGFDFSTKGYDNLVGVVFEYSVTDGNRVTTGGVSWEK